MSYGRISQNISSGSVFQKLKSHKTEGQVRNLVSEGHCHKKYVEIFYCNSWVSSCFCVKHHILGDLDIFCESKAVSVSKSKEYRVFFCIFSGATSYIMLISSCIKRILYIGVRV